jgi:hypothetical protein
MDRVKVFRFLFVIWLGYFFSIPALPFLYKMLLNYPKLENAVVYKGYLSAEGKEQCGISIGRRSFSTGQCTPPRYFVNDDNGKHEIYYYWPPGVKKTRWLNSESDTGSVVGTFWFSPVFGVIQEDIVFHSSKPYLQAQDGKRSFSRYQEGKDDYEYYDYEKYFWHAVPFLVYLVYVFIYIKELFQKTKNHTPQ